MDPTGRPCSVRPRRDAVRAVRGHLPERTDALIIYGSTARWRDWIDEAVAYLVNEYFESAWASGDFAAPVSRPARAWPRRRRDAGRSAGAERLGRRVRTLEDQGQGVGELIGVGDRRAQLAGELAESLVDPRLQGDRVPMRGIALIGDLRERHQERAPRQFSGCTCSSRASNRPSRRSRTGRSALARDWSNHVL